MGLRFNDLADESLRLYNNTLTIGTGGVSVASGAAGAHRIESAVALGADQVWEVASSSPLTVRGTISGAYSLAKTGSGTLNMEADSTYSGSTRVSGGLLAAVATNALRFTTNLLVEAGGQLTTPDNYGAGFYQGTAAYQWATVSGSGSKWTSAGYMMIGDTAGNNRLTVTNGGQVLSTLGVIGFNTSASNNAVVVAGADSSWSNSSSMYLGYVGQNNELLISDGGRVDGTTAVLGMYRTARNNSITVSGSNSLLNLASAMFLGYSGSVSRLVITNGGQVVNSNAYMGYWPQASGCVATVSGPGSCWSNTGQLAVGDEGFNGALAISDGGLVEAGTVYVGTYAASSNSAVNVDGGILRAGSLDIRRGTNTLNSGRVDVGALLLSYTSGQFVFNGGELVTRAATVENLMPFVVGNGSDPAVYRLNEGSHVFTDGLVVNTNATLFANGTLSADSGNVTVYEGGTLGGTGQVLRTVTMQHGAILRTGTNEQHAGTLSVAGLSFQGGARFVYKCDGMATDRVDVAGALGFSGGSVVTLRLEQVSGGEFGKTNVILTYGSLSGTPAFTVDPGDTGLSDTEVVHDAAGTRFLLIVAETYPGSPWTWSGAGGDNNWNSGANWTNNSAPPSTNIVDLVFAGATRLYPSNNVANPFILRHLTFADGSGTFELGGAPLELHGNLNNLSASEQTVALDVTLGAGSGWTASNGNLTVNGAIHNSGNELTFGGAHTVTLAGGGSGGGNVVKTGTGLLRLTADNTFSGAVQVLGGSLEATAAQGLRFATNVQLSGSAKLLTSDETASGFFLADGTRRDATVGSGGVWTNAGGLKLDGHAGNRLNVQGGSLIVSGDFDIILGTNQLQSGTIKASRLLLTNSAGRLFFAGGTLYTYGAEVSNGVVFTVGNGSSAAIYRMRGGQPHCFADGLSVNNNAIVYADGKVGGTAGSVTIQSGGTLAGTGMVERAVMLQAGATLSPGSSSETVGTLSVSNLAFGGNASIVYECDPDGADLVSVAGALDFSGSPVITVRLAQLDGGEFDPVNVIMTYDSLSGTPSFEIDYGSTGLLGCEVVDNADAHCIELRLPQVSGGNPWKWNGGGANARWSTGGNWTNNIAPPSSNDTWLVFSGSTRLVNTNDVANPFSLFSLAFEAGAGTFTLRGAPLTLYGVVENSSASAQTITNHVTLAAGNAWRATGGNLSMNGMVNNDGYFLRVEGSYTTVLNGAISGSGPLRKYNTGLLRLGTNNTYSGETLVNDGTLEARATNSLRGTTNITVENGAQLWTTNQYGAGFFQGSVTGRSALVTGAGSAWSNRNDLRVGDAGYGNNLTIGGGGRLDVAGEGLVGYGPTATGNAVTVTGTGSRWNNSTYLTVGDQGSFNLVSIESGGWLGASSSYLGYYAAATGNTVRVSGSGSVWSNSGALYAGISGKYNQLVITNGGYVRASQGVVGYYSTAISNAVSVGGAGSWLNSTSIFVLGFSGSVSRLTVANGGRLDNTIGYVGAYAAATGNVALVTGADSLWNNSGLFIMGDNASRNVLTISDGGSVQCTEGYIGRGATATNNQVEVTGADSRWFNSDALYVGGYGRGNALLISSNGRVDNTIGYIGYRTGATGNTVAVSGTGSLWNNSDTLYVGHSGAVSRLTVEDGGRVRNGVGYIGFGAAASNNTVLVSGGSWSNSGYLSIGEMSANNTLIVSNGGSVVNGAGYVGWDAAARGNFIGVYGENSVWSNRSLLYLGAYSRANTLIVADGGLVFATNIAVGATSTSSNNVVLIQGCILQTPGAYQLLRGTNTFQGGLMDVGDLYMPLTSGRFIFDGGTLVTRTSSVANGQAFTIGNGQSAAAYYMNEGGHRFANGLIVNTNASLFANGRLLPDSSNVTVYAGGVLAGTGRVERLATLLPGSDLRPGTNAAHVGSLTVSNLTIASGARYVFVCDTAATGRVDVPGTLTFASSPVVTVRLEQVSSGVFGVSNVMFSYGACSGDADWVIDYGDTGLSGYSVTNDAALGQILLVVIPPECGASPWQWNGGGADDNWSDGDNWTNKCAPPSAPTNDLVFSGSVRLTPTNDILNPFQLRNLAFASGADAFTLGGEPLTLFGGITNESPELQTLAFSTLHLGSNSTWTALAGNLAVMSPVNNGGFQLQVDGIYTTTLGGAVSGQGGLVKKNTGVLILAADNSYTGTTRVSGGRLVAVATNALRGSTNLIVELGAKLDTTNEYGAGFYQGPDTGKAATVTGAGSVWSNETTLVVGMSGPGSRLEVLDSGLVTAAELVLGQYSDSSNNALRVSGGWVRAAGDYDIIRGTNWLQSGGLIEAGRVAVTNAGGTFIFDGGTLRTRAGEVDNGEAWIVGNGQSVATHHVNEGAHRFADGLIVNTNAAVYVNGMIAPESGDVTIYAGGRLAGTGRVERTAELLFGATLRPGTNSGDVGSLMVSNLTFMSGSRYLFACDTAATGRVDVPGTLTFASSPVVTVRLEQVSGGAFGEVNVLLTYGALDGEPEWKIDFGSTGIERAYVTNDAAFSRILLVVPHCGGNPWRWDGGGAESVWSDEDNWTNQCAPTSDSSRDLVFGGVTRLVVTNDVANPFHVRYISFADDAGAFVLNGSPIILYGGISNFSAEVQTIVNDIVFASDTAKSSSEGVLNIQGAIDNGGHTLDMDVAGEMELANAVSGAGGLIKDGDGTLLLGGANSYSGGTHVNGGILKGTAGSLQGAITNHGVLWFDQATGATNGSRITGSGSLRKTGAGFLALTNVLTFAGAVSVEAGKLHIHSISNSGAVNVYTGATLIATGHVGHLAVTGGAVSAVMGAAPGKLTCTNLVMTHASRLDVGISSATSSMIHVTGNMALSGTITVNVTNLGGADFWKEKTPIIYYKGTDLTESVNFQVIGDIPSDFAGALRVRHEITGSGIYYLEGASPDVEIHDGTPSTNYAVSLSVGTVSNMSYDLIYVDGVRYLDAYTNAGYWTRAYKFIAPGTNTTVTNNIAALSPNLLRFYRISPAGAWSNPAYANYVSEQIYVGKLIPLYGGRNWISLPCEPVPATLNNILGPGANLPANTYVYIYSNQVEGTTNKLVVDKTYNTPPGGGNWTDGGNALLPFTNGFVVVLPTNAANCKFGVAGKMRTQTNEMLIKGGRALTFVTTVLPSDMHPKDLNLVWDMTNGFQGATAPRDRLYLYESNQVAGCFFWYNKSEGAWYKSWNGQKVADGETPIKQNSAYIIQSAPSTPDWVWTNAFYYAPPVKELNP